MEVLFILAAISEIKFETAFVGSKSCKSPGLLSELSPAKLA